MSVAVYSMPAEAILEASTSSVTIGTFMYGCIGVLFVWKLGSCARSLLVLVMMGTGVFHVSRGLYVWYMGQISSLGWVVARWTW